MALYGRSKSVEDDDCGPVWLPSKICTSFTYKATGISFDTIYNQGKKSQEEMYVQEDNHDFYAHKNSSLLVTDERHLIHGANLSHFIEITYFSA